MNGAYYSDTLLNAILSHSVRWCKSEPQISRLLDQFDGGAEFSHRAVTGLFDSLQVGYAGIPTIQNWASGRQFINQHINSLAVVDYCPGQLMGEQRLR